MTFPQRQRKCCSGDSEIQSAEQKRSGARDFKNCLGFVCLLVSVLLACGPWSLLGRNQDKTETLWQSTELKFWQSY